MADPRKRLSENVSGDLFVDSTCIDCDTCRQLAPGIFGETGKFSYVRRQALSTDEHRAAMHALLACPTGSIGTLGRNDAKAAIDDFPLPIDGSVYYCGYNSPKSYGGNSYFVLRPGGNWLIDSPKYLPQLVRKFEQFGGVANIFLTHRDDVADAARYAAHFRSQRIIHRRELAAQPDAELVIDGLEPIDFESGVRIIPTIGHTEGHCCLLLDDRYLFTGDHLSWDRDTRRLDASEDYCWYSWDDQRRSIEILRDERFEWVLPGHGQRVHLPQGQMRAAVDELLVRVGTP